MSDFDQLTEHIIDLKETCSAISENIKSLRHEQNQHRQEMIRLADDVSEVEKDLSSQRGAIKALKWVLAFAVGVPGVIYTISRLMASQ